MNTLTSISKTPTPAAASTTPGIMIIYEDTLTGFQAKRFSDSLTASLGCLGKVTPALWRSELLILAGVATEMTSDAAHSEFVILSLRGDRGLSVELKEWIEGWLGLARGGSSSLIALFDRARSVGTCAESVRCYLRQVSSEAGIPFFAHCFTPANAAEELFAGEGEGAAVSRPDRRRPRAQHTLLPGTVAA